MVDLSKRRLFTRKKVDSCQAILPWLVEQSSFTDDCTRCGKCIEKCDSNIIIKGDGGFPQVDFSRGECTFCYQCANACPEPLFNAQHESPWNAKATISSRCLASNKIECRSCGDMCESMAIKFRLRSGDVALPKIELEDCSGCGACVAVCPGTAITVSNEYLNQSGKTNYDTK